jgi:hypothetical protein
VQEDFQIVRGWAKAMRLGVYTQVADDVIEAVERIEEQLETLQEKARRFLVVTGGQPERMEDVGKARRELVDALHASTPAKRPYVENA